MDGDEDGTEEGFSDGTPDGERDIVGIVDGTPDGVIEFDGEIDPDGTPEGRAEVEGLGEESVEQRSHVMGQYAETKPPLNSRLHRLVLCATHSQF